MQINSGGSRETRLANQLAAALARIVELEREHKAELLRIHVELEREHKAELLRIHNDKVDHFEARIAAEARAERLEAALNKLIRFAQSLSEQASDMTCQYEAEEIYLHGVPQLLQEASGVIEEARAVLAKHKAPA